MVAEQTLRWIYGAAPLSFAIPQVLRGQIWHRRFQLFLLSHASCWASPCCAWRACGCCSTAPRSGAWCAPACRTPTWSARSASRSNPTWPRVAALGIGLAGLAGVLLAPIYAVHPAMGQEIITPAFVVVVIGGLGSFWGVVVAALLVGLVKGLIIAFGYTAFSTAAIYLLMMLDPAVPSARPVRRAHPAVRVRRGMLGDRSPLLIAAAALIACRSRWTGIGLGVTSATEVVIFAMACMALNILVGYTGLVSFGHGAWFGLGAYLAGMLQRELTARFDACCRSWRRWSSSRCRRRRIRLSDPAPPRRLFRAADDGDCPP